MTIDATAPRSRRAVLVGACSGVAAWALAAIGRPVPARAGVDGDVVLGASNAASATTTVHNAASVANSAGLVGRSDTGMTGLFGLSAASLADPAPDLPGNAGVFGWADTDIESIGVWGASTKGVGVRGMSDRLAVYGDTDAGIGVGGLSQTGTAVNAYSTSGTGLVVATSTGVAVDSTGRLRLHRASGVASFRAGRSSYTVKPGIDVTPSSFVFLTPNADLGGRRLWYTLDAKLNTFTIRLSSATTRSVRVSWLLLG